MSTDSADSADSAETPLVRERLLELLERRCGINTAGGRPPGWLVSRVDRAAQALVESARAQQQDVVTYLERHPAELEQLAELVRVGETRFFRDPEQWQALATALPRLLPQRSRHRALSAGCSTGEEAFTLAMLLATAALAPFRVVGVDRSATALTHARSAIYAEECRAQIPQAHFERFLRPRAGALTVTPELRDTVSFVQRDLLTGPPPGNYELIVCKNLLIYLKPEAGDRVLRSLFTSLSPGGLLLIARAELGKAKSMGLPLETIASGVSIVRKV